jgi:hypothetical protein
LILTVNAHENLMSANSTVSRKKSQRKPKNHMDLSVLAASSRNLKYEMGVHRPVISNPQPLVILKLQGQSQIVTATATGTISRSFSITPALVNNFATRWGVVFREFLITRVVCTVRATAGNTGQTAVWIDELNATAPTATDAGQNTHVLVSNATGNDPSVATLTWRLAEINDAGFNSAASGSPTPAIVKFYTDPNMGSAMTSGNSVLLFDTMLTVVFRGII